MVKLSSVKEFRFNFVKLGLSSKAAFIHYVLFHVFFNGDFV